MMTAGFDPPIGDKAKLQTSKVPKEGLLKNHSTHTTDSPVKKLKLGVHKGLKKANASSFCNSGTDEEDNNNEHAAQGFTRRTRAGRMLRNRRYRRAFEENRQTKKLFTPEIKRFLKGWLVRRRKNPYPNRNEKKELAVKTGLTYIQICNWFANWRRKLKNSCTEDQKRTWGHLIKGYNTQAHGNVEQFSISSDDSIWDETTYKEDSPDSLKGNSLYYTTSTAFDHCYTSDTVKCTQSAIKPVTQPETGSCNTPIFICSEKNTKRKLVEDTSPNEPVKKQKVTEPPMLLTKWLESAANFRPRESYISWATHNVTWQSPLAKKQAKPKPRQPARSETALTSQGRHREELDAAEALTYLSHSPAINLHRQCIPPISGH